MWRKTEDGRRITTDNTKGSFRPSSFVSGSHILVWQEGGITYRLEVTGSLEDAVKIAESLL